MTEISELERGVIQVLSTVGAFVAFGLVVPLTVFPVEAGILTAYEKLKGREGKAKKLYEENFYKILSKPEKLKNPITLNRYLTI